MITLRHAFLGAVLLAAFSATRVVAAAPGAGTLADPIVLPENPFAVRGTTVDAPSAITGYACDGTVDESGGEVVYRIEAPIAGKLTAWVEGDGDGVDIDVHVLSGTSLEGGIATDCVARANVITEPVLDPGTYFVVVDTFDGPEQAGEFVLHVTLIGDAWTELEAYEGVTWRARRYPDLAGGEQVVHQLLVDLDNRFVTVEAIQSTGCTTVGNLGAQVGAVAGINGGYFNVATCAPVSLLKHGGELLSTNGSSRSAFGLTPEVEPLIALIGAGDDWPEVAEAHGGAPRLVTDGTAHTDNDEYAVESVVEPGFIGRNPRTVAGIDADGRVLFYGVDGRRDTAYGMSLPNLANYSVDLGLVDAVNLDGGGSTTVWMDGVTPNGVLNYPSDAGAVEGATHGGSRGVSGGFFVFSEPKNFAPVFSSEPPSAADLDAAHIYDADAYDKNALDVVGFSLEGAPDGMTIDADTGLVTWSPEGVYPAHVSVTIVASDGQLSTPQTMELDVPGGVETTVGSGGGTAQAGGGDAAGGAGQGGESSGDGCSCRLGGASETRGRGAVGALVAFSLLGLRRRTQRKHG